MLLLQCQKVLFHYEVFGILQAARSQRMDYQRGKETYTLCPSRLSVLHTSRATQIKEDTKRHARKDDEAGWVEVRTAQAIKACA